MLFHLIKIVMLLNLIKIFAGQLKLNNLRRLRKLIQKINNNNKNNNNNNYYHFFIISIFSTNDVGCEQF